MPAFLSFLFLFFVHEPSQARLRNQNLAPQIVGDPERRIPQGENFNFAVDGHFFTRHNSWGGSGTFAGVYHGGWWVPLYTEYRVHSNLALNLKTVFYNPAASYGTVATGYMHPFFAMTWKDNLAESLGPEWNILWRFGDQDRVTLGSGLTLQQKETNGILMELTRDWFQFRFINNGTGGFDVSGDLNYLSVNLWQELIGIYAMTHRMETAAFLGIYSNWAVTPEIRVLSEVSTRNQAIAGMGAVQWDHLWGRLHISARADSRFYGNRYAEEIKGQIEHDFLTIEMEDKFFLDSMNVFVYDDSVIATGAVLNLTYTLSDRLKIFSQNEYASFMFERLSQRDTYFYRHGISFYPRANGNESLDLFLGNRSVAVTRFNLWSNERENSPNFIQLPYFSIEGRFRF